MSFTRNATQSVVVNKMDVLYVGQQINRDLQALSRAYPEKLSSEKAASLFDSYTTFLLNYAVSMIGFSIYNPADRGLVYHEYRYAIEYGTEVRQQVGTGGERVNRVTLPSSTIFSEWVTWSDHMMKLSVREQELIVKGTGWNIPGKNPSFNGRYEGGNWIDRGGYGRGVLMATLREYKFGQ